MRDNPQPIAWLAWQEQPARLLETRRRRAWPVFFLLALILLVASIFSLQQVSSAFSAASQRAWRKTLAAILQPKSAFVELAPSSSADAQSAPGPFSQGPPFPRLAAFTWGGGVADYYAHFDLLDWSTSDPQAALAIKAINPHIKIVVTRDINKGLGRIEGFSFPDAWKVRTSTGEFCTIYGGDDFYADYTNFAPRLPEFGNQRYNEYVDDLMLQLVDLTVFDGIATDGLWGNYWGGPPCNEDIDLDRNGANDYQEHGRAWVADRIREGAVETVRNLRAAIGPDKLLIINSGGPHAWAAEESNGFIHEHFNGVYGFDWLKKRYDEWIATSAQPSTPIVNADTLGGSPVQPEKNDFQLMRYGLAFSLITGAYFDFTDYGRAGEHYWVRLYDEFELNLGYPTGPAQKTASGAWVRFFDHGMVIINGTDRDTITVSVDEVEALQGYNPGSTGYYWRIRGGQDIAVNGPQATNNGLPFDDANPITLTFRRENPTVTEGLILMREPTTAVADITIDNADSGTSPGSLSPGDTMAASMRGFRQADDCKAGAKYYTTRCAVYVDPQSSPPDTTYLSPPFATAPGGSAAQAIYTPNIGIGGRYAVYEWHGTLAQGQPASNVAYTIEHAGGSEMVIVDQGKNPGQWNLLGIFEFQPGTAGRVIISAQGADGTVIADAIKFVYQGDASDQVFADVPPSHWAYEEIQLLYQQGFIAGCSTQPLLYCPERILNRAESAVFVMRGVHSAQFTPPNPTSQIFTDLPLSHWAVEWVSQLWQDGYTAGCNADPLQYCADRTHTRAEGSVFFLRMRNGKDFAPPPAQGLFADVPLQAWYAPWIEEAYRQGILDPCQRDPQLLACPEEPLDRASAAVMMVRAKELNAQEANGQ